MELHPWPKKIFIFDIHGTLNFNDLNISHVPAQLMFDVLRKDKEIWIGVCSGMYTWMQLQEMSDHGLIPDFVIMKCDGYTFIKSLEKIYERKFDCRVIWVGDQQEDREWAKTYGWDFLLPSEFTKKYLINAGHISRSDFTQ